VKQMTFAGAKGFEVHGRATRKAEFLARMDALVPWGEFCALVEPHYPRAGNGRPPVGVERMLRMYLLANWFNLSDEACEDALYDMPAFRDFCRIDLGRERAPDATTLLRFRHFLEAQQIGAALFSKVSELLLAQGMKLSGGTIVDATLIEAPSSTKNEEQKRDAQMQQTKKGNQWYFGMKVHIGMDSQSGLVHSASVSAANVHDSQELPHLLHGQERRLGDSAYRGKNQRAQLKQIAPCAKDFTNKRAHRHRALSQSDRQTNRRKSAVRAKVEHPFLTLKRIWGFMKVRYRGLAKNANRAYAMLALINIGKWGRRLTAEVSAV